MMFEHPMHQIGDVEHLGRRTTGEESQDIQFSSQHNRCHGRHGFLFHNLSYPTLSSLMLLGLLSSLLLFACAAFLLSSSSISCLSFTRPSEIPCHTSPPIHNEYNNDISIELQAVKPPQTKPPTKQLPAIAIDFPDPCLFQDDVGTWYSFATNKLGHVNVQTAMAESVDGPWIMLEWDALPVVGPWALNGAIWAPDVGRMVC